MKMASIFEEDYDVRRIINAIEINMHVQIDSGNTLIIFDEVQAAPKVVESLKYFCEDAPEYAIIVAGSLLGVALHEGISFPVGKVDEKHLYPMSFEEFLEANNEEKLASYIADYTCNEINEFSQRYIFFFGQIKKGARHKDYEVAIQWLVDAGLIYKVHKVSKPAMPLKSYIDLSAFKLYMIDIGLMGAMSELDIESVLLGNELFVEFKGALTEQYVLQQIVANTDYTLYYYSGEKSTYEMDYIIQKQSVIPIEVKAEQNGLMHNENWQIMKNEMCVWLC